MKTRSFYAKYRAIDNKWLIGGVQQSQSCRFQAQADAQRMLDTAIELNGSHCVGEVVPSEKPPEIFSHCPGSIPQSIGGKCFGCGHVLTAEDARNVDTH